MRTGRYLVIALGAAAWFGPVSLTAEVATVDVEAPAAATEPGVHIEDARLQDAARDLASGDWKLARRKARAVLAADKKSKEAWLVWGRACLAGGRYRKAVRRFNKALKRDPHYAPAYYWKAQAFEAWGRIDEAANEYQAAFHADPHLEVAKSAWRRLRDQTSVSDE